MKRQYLLLDARIYLREWGVPFAVAIGLIALGIVGYLYLTGHFKTELSNRSMHHADPPLSALACIGLGRSRDSLPRRNSSSGFKKFHATPCTFPV